MSFAVVVLVARIALVAVLYLFLATVVRAVYRDLRAVGVATSAAPPPRVPAGPYLVVLAAGKTSYQVGRQFPLRNPTLLGRDPSTDIPVEDDFVSGQHLRLLGGSNGWLAQDLNSTNGTKLNGAKLQGTVRIKHGDVLDLGLLRLRFGMDH